MTETEFIWQEIETWGFEEIDDLLQRGFRPVFTDRGWKWLRQESEVSARVRRYTR